MHIFIIIYYSLFFEPWQNPDHLRDAENDFTYCKLCTDRKAGKKAANLHSESQRKSHIVFFSYILLTDWDREFILLLQNRKTW